MKDILVCEEVLETIKFKKKVNIMKKGLIYKKPDYDNGTLKL